MGALQVTDTWSAGAQPVLRVRRLQRPELPIALPSISATQRTQVINRLAHGRRGRTARVTAAQPACAPAGPARSSLPALGDVGPHRVVPAPRKTPRPSPQPQLHADVRRRPVRGPRVVAADARAGHLPPVTYGEDLI
jgi:hypothetical protein